MNAGMMTWPARSLSQITDYDATPLFRGGHE